MTLYFAGNDYVQLEPGGGCKYFTFVMKFCYFVSITDFYASQTEEFAKQLGSKFDAPTVQQLKTFYQEAVDCK